MSSLCNTDDIKLSKTSFETFFRLEFYLFDQTFMFSLY